MTLHATLYPCAYDAKPASVDAFDSWDEFTAALSDLVRVIAPAKERCPYFGPYALEGDTRNDANVSAVSCLVSDLDSIADLERDVLAPLRAANVSAFVYESPSSTDANPRVRIVCPVSRPITRAEAAHTRLAFAEALGLEPGCGADGVLPASIGFYAGRVAGTRERRTWRVEGSPVDVDALVAAPLTHAWGKRAAREPRTPREAPRDVVEPTFTERVFELAARTEARWLAGDRETDNFEKAFYGWLLGTGWSRAEIVGLVECLDSNEPDPRKRAEHARKARTATRLDGPSDAVRAWFGDDFAGVDELATRARREWWAAREERRARERAAARAESGTLDTLFGRRYYFGDPEEPLVYYCPGLGLAQSDGKISLIGGAPGAAKGPIADHLALCFAFGAPAFGQFDCARAKTLFLDCEGRRLTMRRMRRMARAMGRDPETLDGGALEVFDASSAELHEPTVQAELIRYVHENDFVVVVLDSYTSAMLASGLEANQPGFAQLAKALGSMDRLVLTVAHTNKAAAKGKPGLADIAYTGAIGAMAQTAIVAHYPDEDDKNTVHFACVRSPEPTFKPFHVKFTDREDGALALTYEAVPEKIATPREPRVTATAIEAERQAREARRRIEDYMGPRGQGAALESRRELVSVGGEGPAAGERALARLVEDGVLVRVHGGFTRAR